MNNIYYKIKKYNNALIYINDDEIEVECNKHSGFMINNLILKSTTQCIFELTTKNDIIFYY